MAEYTLMNKNHPVVSFRYDRDIHAVVKIVDVHDLRYAPVALADSKGIVTRRALNDWWRRRAIPASRHQIQQLLDSLNLNSTLELAEENFGLSLSDRYWINNSKNPLKWEDVNFFDNDFTDDLGMLTLGQESSGNPNLMSPNSTLGGDLNKKWKIVNGRRILVKGGTGSTRQEVLNEVVATALYNRLLSRNDCNSRIIKVKLTIIFSITRQAAECAIIDFLEDSSDEVFHSTKDTSPLRFGAIAEVLLLITHELFKQPQESRDDFHL